MNIWFSKTFSLISLNKSCSRILSWRAKQACSLLTSFMLMTLLLGLALGTFGLSASSWTHHHRKRKSWLMIIPSHARWFINIVLISCHEQPERRASLPILCVRKLRPRGGRSLSQQHPACVRALNCQDPQLPLVHRKKWNGPLICTHKGHKTLNPMSLSPEFVLSQCASLRDLLCQVSENLQLPSQCSHDYLCTPPLPLTQLIITLNFFSFWIQLQISDL